MYQRIRKGLRLLEKDILALLPAIVALAGYWTVTHLLFDRFCPMQILLGLPCPGCGMTRSLGLVLTGHLAAAWKMQPPVYGWMVAGVVFGVQRYLVNREESEPEEGILDCKKSGKSEADVENRRNKQAKNVDMGSDCSAALGDWSVSVAYDIWFPGERGRSGADSV